MGYSVFGKEIYVDEEDYDRAKKLLDSVAPDKVSGKGGIEGKPSKLPRFAAWFALIVVVVPIIFALINSVWK